MTLNMSRKNHFDMNDGFYLNDLFLDVTRQDKQWTLEEIQSYLSENLGRVMCICGKSLLIKISEYSPHSLLKIKDFPKSHIHMTNGKSISLKYLIFNKLKWLLSDIEYQSIRFGFHINRHELNEFQAVSSFVANPSKPEGIGFEMLITFIRNIICGQKEDAFEYFMKWLAFAWKFPEMKSGVPILLYGLSCTGKSTLTNFLCTYVFGENCSISNYRYKGVFGRKNYNLVGKKLIVIHELSDRKESEKNLQSLTTDTKIVINKMYHDYFSIKNYLEVIFCVSDRDTLRVEKKNKRFFIINVSDELTRNGHFFCEFREAVFNQETGNAFTSYLETLLNSPEDFLLLKDPRS